MRKTQAALAEARRPPLIDYILASEAARER
jgi:hypothetical protein